MALESYAGNVYGSRQFGDLSVLVIHLTKAAGVASLDAATSSPDVRLLTQPGAGVYTFDAPAGVLLHFVGGGVDPAANAIAAGVGSYVFPRALVPSNGAGRSTFTLVVEASDGVEVDFPDTGHLYATFLLGAP